MPLNSEFGDDFRQIYNSSARQTDRLRRSIDRLERTVRDTSIRSGSGGGGGGIGGSAAVAATLGILAGRAGTTRTRTRTPTFNLRGSSAELSAQELELRRVERDLARRERRRAIARAIPGALLKYGTLAAGAGTITAVAGITRARIDQDRLSSAIAVYTGNQESANAAYQRFAQISQEVGAHAKSNIAAFGLLAAAAKGNVQSFSDLEDIYRGVTTASAAFHLSAEQQGRALTAIQQSFSKGRIQSEELVGQLAEALPGAINVAKKAFVSLGGSADNFFKALERGEISPQKFFPEFGRQLSEEHAAQAERNADKITGSINKMSNAWDTFMRNLAIGSLGDLITKGFAGVASGIESVDRALNPTINHIREFTRQLDLYKSRGEVPQNIRDMVQAFGQGLPSARRPIYIPENPPRPPIGRTPPQEPVLAPSPWDKIAEQDRPFLSPRRRARIERAESRRLSAYAINMENYAKRLEEFRKRQQADQDAYQIALEKWEAQNRREQEKLDEQFYRGQEPRRVFDAFMRKYTALPDAKIGYSDTKLSRPARRFFDDLVNQSFGAQSVVQGYDVFRAHRTAEPISGADFRRIYGQGQEVTGGLRDIRNADQFNALLRKTQDQFGSFFKDVPFAQDLRDLEAAKIAYATAVHAQIDVDQRSAQATRDLVSDELALIDARENSAARVANTVDKLAEDLGEFSTIKAIKDFHEIKGLGKDFIETIIRNFQTEIYRVTITDPLKAVIEGFVDRLIYNLQTKFTQSQMFDLGSNAAQSLISAAQSYFSPQQKVATLPQMHPDIETFHTGGVATRMGQLARLRTGESVLTPNQLTQVLHAGSRMGGGSPRLNITINNNSSEPVDVQEDGSGGLQIDIGAMLDDAIAQTIAKPGNTSEAILGLTGTQRRVIMR